MGNLLPINLQFFAEGDGAQNAGGEEQSQQQNTSTAIDYDKIQSMISKGAQQKENAILKSYFQQQGLSETEAAQAIADFKQQKQSQQPDVAGIQSQLSQAQELAKNAEIEKLAVLEAVSLNIDAKTIPYVLKMADFKPVVGQDGKINTESIKAAISKVLEDVPQLKPSSQSNTGFRIGGDSGGQQTTNMDDALKAAFGL